MIENRIVTARKAGRVAFGIYLSTASTKVIELIGFAGLDFVRIDLEGSFPDSETIAHLIHAAHAVGVTPVVRVTEPMDIGFVWRVINLGALGVIIPRINGRAHAEEAVRAVKPKPIGMRKVRPDNIVGGYGLVGRGDLDAWSAENVLLAVQVETKGAVEAIDEIASVPGVDMLISGRHDLSLSYGVPGQNFAPVVLEAERRMVEAGKRAGKITSVTYFPLRGGDQFDRMRQRIREGVDCVVFGSDNELGWFYKHALEQLSDEPRVGKR